MRNYRWLGVLALAMAACSPDADEDGARANVDCDDSNAAILVAGTADICDGLDNDCDGQTDEDAVGGSVFFADGDGDGFGDSATSVYACAAPTGHVAVGGDCDDAAADVNPGVVEVCNGKDDDCVDGIDVGASDAAIWYRDADADGHGNADAMFDGCDPGDGWSTDAEDCNDRDATISPDAAEYCDGVDRDCDGEIDGNNAVDALVWYRDADLDGFGDTTDAQTACYQPVGYLLDAGDCDDSDVYTWPGAAWAESTECMTDVDGDGWGATTVANGVTAGTDCDDADDVVYPGAPEYCSDEVDNNCDTLADCDEAACDTYCAYCWDVDAEYLTGTSVATGSTTSETDDYPSVSGCGSSSSSGNDVGIVWAAPSTGCWQLDTDGSGFDTVIRVYDGCYEDGASLVGCDDDGGAGLQSLIQIDATAGDHFIVVVDGFSSSSSGTYVFSANACP